MLSLYKGKQNDTKVHGHLGLRHGNTTRVRSPFLADNRPKNYSLLVSRAQNEEIPVRIFAIHISSGLISGPNQA